MNAPSNTTTWPNGATVSQVCFTRATRNLESLLGFYRDGLGLEVLYRFDDDAGPAGAMIGLPGRGLHLELLRANVADCAPPSKHNVMVLHLPQQADVAALAARLRERGCVPVAPVNPWWADRAVVFEDPDGWPVVLSHGSGLPE
jgi:catechol 2,3-dioxygenase-like lactoylglutathione lyase family enzyme